jgi:hypothetical protein
MLATGWNVCSFITVTLLLPEFETYKKVPAGFDITEYGL